MRRDQNKTKQSTEREKEKKSVTNEVFLLRRFHFEHPGSWRGSTTGENSMMWRNSRALETDRVRRQSQLLPTDDTFLPQAYRTSGHGFEHPWRWWWLTTGKTSIWCNRTGSPWKLQSDSKRLAGLNELKSYYFKPEGHKMHGDISTTDSKSSNVLHFVQNGASCTFLKHDCQSHRPVCL